PGLWLSRLQVMCGNCSGFFLSFKLQPRVATGRQPKRVEQALGEAAWKRAREDKQGTGGWKHQKTFRLSGSDNSPFRQFSTCWLPKGKVLFSVCTCWYPKEGRLWKKSKKFDRAPWPSWCSRLLMFWARCMAMVSLDGLSKSVVTCSQ